MANKRPVPANLALLRLEFGRRDEWWKGVIARAGTARASHGELVKKSFEAIHATKDAAAGFSTAGIVAEKYSHRPHGNLESYYRDRSVFENTVQNPLQRICMDSDVSQDRPSFWQKNAMLMVDGRHDRVGKRLDRAENFFNRLYIRMRYGGHALNQWRNDIASARAAIPMHKNAHEKLKRIDALISQGEENIASAIHKILKEGRLRKALAHPDFAAAVQKNDLLKPFAAYAARDFKVSKEDIIADIRDSRWRITPARLEKEFKTLSEKAAGQAKQLDENLKMAQHRYGYCGEFIRSAKAARSMEIKRSLIVGGMSTDLKGALDAASGNTVDLAHAASVKMRRWVDTEEIEKKLLMLEKADFAPADVDPLPRLDYVCNATSDSFRRVVGNPVKNMLSSAWQGTQRSFGQVARAILPGRKPNP